MATQEEIKVGSIVSVSLLDVRASAGIVVAYPGRPRRPAAPRRAARADVYWFKSKLTDWEYISYLEVLVK